jgi:GTPase SAR1 family protein
MTTKNKIELLNALLESGGHSRSITIKDKTSHTDLGHITVKVDFNMSEEVNVNLSEVLSNTFSENFSMSEIYELAGKIAGILDKPWDKYQDPIDTQISEEVTEMYKQIVLDLSDEIHDKAWDTFETEHLEEVQNTRSYSRDLKGRLEMNFQDEEYNHAFGILVTNKDVSK